MTANLKILALTIYSLAVIASGMVRYFSADGGSTGLWFGISMGLFGLAGVAFMFTGKHFSGAIVCVAAILLVGGWFCYESFVKKGIDDAELRQLIMIGFSAIALAVAILPVSVKAEGSDESKPKRK